MRPGGGATDFRLIPGGTNTEWNKPVSLNSRILVAGGGGGGDGGRYSGTSLLDPGSPAGGLTGYNSTKGGAITGGGEQTKGGKGGGQGYDSSTHDGAFGTGGKGSGCRSGGGGGYYGGSAGVEQGSVGGGPGAGGSSFISGMTGCVAIDSADTTNDPRTQDGGTGLARTTLNYNNSVFGSTNSTWVDGEDILFTNY